MIHLIGIKKDLELNIRAKMSIAPSDMERILSKIKAKISSEVVIINTCNRTELYINTAHSKDYILNAIVNILNWKAEYLNYIFYSNEDKAVMHLFEVACGFHSRILGEDQILGQIKEAYSTSVQEGMIKSDFHKLFSLALSCGKEFKTKTKLYEVPVSYSSIAAHEALNKGCKNIALVGFGKMAQLAFNYFVSRDFDTIYILGRDTEKINNSSLLSSYKGLIQEGKIVVAPLDEQKNIYSKVDSIICCTSSPTPIILKEMLPSNKLLIFDLSLPSNVASSCKELPNVTLYDLDNLQDIDGENKLLRKKVMFENKEILHKHYMEYENYLKVKSIAPMIKSIKEVEAVNTENHLKTFKNKRYTKSNESLVEVLLNSTSNTYVNKAIEVLKEEALKGDSNKAFDIIKKIFIDNIN